MEISSTFKAGKVAGFFCSMLVFSTVFYFVMSFLGKMPEQIQYYHVILTVSIAYVIGVFAWWKRKGAI